MKYRFGVTSRRQNNDSAFPEADTFARFITATLSMATSPMSQS